MIKREKIIGIFGAMLVALGSLSADDIKPNGCKGPSLCTDLPLEESCGFYFNVGLIYEQMRISNAIGGYERTQSPVGTSASPDFLFNILNLNFNMEPGFKFGVGYEPGHDDWQVNASFEWLRSSASLNKEVLEPSYLYSQFTGVYRKYSALTSTLDVDYFLLDVYLSRGSYISQKYSLEPFAGFKASWIYYDTRESFTNSPDLITTSQQQLHVLDDDFWGIGPMIGLNGNYHLYAGWSIFALSDFSILFGESALNYYEGIVTTEPLPGNNVVETTSIVASPTMRGVVGIQYERCVMCESQHLVLRAGFDARVYFNQYPLAYMSQSYDPTSNTTNFNIGNFQTMTSIINNNSFSMIGLLLDLGWSF